MQMNSCEGEVVSNAVSRSKSAFFLRENMGFTQKTGTERNDDNERNDDTDDDDAVSYTHLTLPTILRV